MMVIVMLILIDTREKTPLDFSIYPCNTKVATLTTGDYSLKGFENIVALERKSENDLLQSLTHERERFERELARLRGFTVKAVLCETSWVRLGHGEYKSQMKPHACLQSILGLTIRYDIQFYMVENRMAAAYTAFHIFRHFIEQREKELKAILKQGIETKDKQEVMSK